MESNTPTAEDRYSSIIRDVRQNMGVDPDDTSYDAVILKMPQKGVFCRFLAWNGILGYEDAIIGAIEEIYKVDLEGLD